MNYKTVIPTIAVMVTTALVVVTASGQQVEAADSIPREADTHEGHLEASATGEAARPTTLVTGYPKVCPGLGLKVPRAAIAAALEDPTAVSGWNKLSNPNLPPSSFNPRRRMLTVLAPNKHYHPLYNPLIFRAGCTR
jgi:hypothetical protein